MYKEMFTLQKYVRKNAPKLKVLIAPAVILLIFFGLKAMLNPYYVSGASMEPTLTDSTFILTDAVTDSTVIKRGDIVVAKVGDGLFKKTVIKRVIGLPGESVVLTNESIFINGEEIEDYVESPPIAAEEIFKMYELGENEYFLLGDNRPVSRDSRTYGAVARDNIKAIYSMTLFSK